MSYGEQQRPRLVEVGASLLAIVGVLSVGRVAYGVVVNLGQDWEAGARGVFLVLNSFVLIFSLFIVVLSYQVRKGRQWAWIVGIVVLLITIAVGGLLLLMTVIAGSASLAGAAIVPVSIAALLVLTVPRSVRGYFVRPPVPHWSPGYPPA